MKSCIRAVDLLAVTALCMVLAACDESATGIARVEGTVGSNETGLTQSCVVALAAHEGTSEIDRTIARLQQRASGPVTPAAYLERLGWAYVAKARESFDPGFYKLAEQTALCISSVQPDSQAVLLLHGHVLHNLHRFKAGETVARKLVAERGLWLDYALLGDVLMEQGKLDQALKAYQRMMDGKPGATAYARAAHMRWLKGELEGAIEIMRSAARASGSKEAGAWIYSRLALYELQAGEFERASDAVQTALGLVPAYPPALLAQGRMLLAESDFVGAIAVLEKAAMLNPLPEYQWTLIEALEASGHRRQASEVEIGLLERGAIDDRRTHALYLASTGQQIDTALRLAQQELEVRRDVFTLDALAWAFAANGDLREALAYSKLAVAEGTQDARLFYHAGVIAAGLGLHEDAAAWLHKAMSMQQMLLPSEQARLRKEFAVFRPQITDLAFDGPETSTHL